LKSTFVYRAFPVMCGGNQELVTLTTHDTDTGSPETQSTPHTLTNWNLSTPLLCWVLSQTPSHWCIPSWLYLTSWYNTNYTLTPTVTWSASLLSSASFRISLTSSTARPVCSRK